MNENNIVFMKKDEALQCVEWLLKKKIERISIKMKSSSNLQTILKEDVKMDKQERINKLKEMGFISKDPTHLFEFIISKYQRMDQEFASTYQQILDRYKS